MVIRCLFLGIAIEKLVHIDNAFTEFQIERTAIMDMDLIHFNEFL